MSHATAPKPARRCPDCGTAVGSRKSFCDAECRARFHNRSSKRGRVLMPLAMAWRGRYGRSDTAKKAYREMWLYLDKCNAEDRAAGRPPMVEHVESLLHVASPHIRWRDR